MDKKYTKNIECGLRLKECRKSKGLTQEKLAISSNYSVQTVSYIENGTRNMSREAAHAFSKILEVREEYLLCEDNAKTVDDLSRTIEYQYRNEKKLLKVFNGLGYWEFFKFIDTPKTLNTEFIEIEKVTFCIPGDQFVTCTEKEYDAFLEEIQEYIRFKLNHFTQKCRPSSEDEIKEFKKHYLWDVLGDEEI